MMDQSGPEGAENQNSFNQTPDARQETGDASEQFEQNYEENSGEDGYTSECSEDYAYDEDWIDYAFEPTPQVRRRSPQVLLPDVTGHNAVEDPFNQANQERYAHAQPVIFERTYRCFAFSFAGKSDRDSGNQIIIPQSALDSLSGMVMESSHSPLLFEICNLQFLDKRTHCGVREFIAQEGSVLLPNWMMESMKLEEGDCLSIKSVKLEKASYVKIQPHTMDFLDIPDLKATLEGCFRNFFCLTTGETIKINHNGRDLYINITETKPSSAVCMHETDCQVVFAPALDYKEPERPAQLEIKEPETPSQSAKEVPMGWRTFIPFTGRSSRLDGETTSSSPSSSASSAKEEIPIGHEAKRSNTKVNHEKSSKGNLKRRGDCEGSGSTVAVFKPFTGKHCKLGRP